MVAPFAGAWIEILVWPKSDGNGAVAPFAGAWIEMGTLIVTPSKTYVAPFAGAWIEISTEIRLIPWSMLSLPSRERGLK